MADRFGTVIDLGRGEVLCILFLLFVYMYHFSCCHGHVAICIFILKKSIKIQVTRQHCHKANLTSFLSRKS